MAYQVRLGNQHEGLPVNLSLYRRRRSSNTFGECRFTRYIYIYIYEYTHILCTRLKVPLPCQRPCLHFRCTSANHTLQSRESTLALLVSSGGKKARRPCDPLMQKETPSWKLHMTNNRKWWIKPVQGTHSWHLPAACEACACRTWSFLQLPRLGIYYQPNKCHNSTIFQKCASNRLTHAMPWILNHLFVLDIQREMVAARNRPAEFPYSLYSPRNKILDLENERT